MKINCVIIIWNVITMTFYGVDKWCAVKGYRRIPEKILLFCAFFMGALGALTGMYAFRHKTLKWKFRIVVPLFYILNLACAYAFFNFPEIWRR